MKPRKFIDDEGVADSVSGVGRSSATERDFTKGPVNGTAVSAISADASFSVNEHSVAACRPEPPVPAIRVSKRASAEDPGSRTVRLPSLGR